MMVIVVFVVDSGLGRVESFRAVGGKELGRWGRRNDIGQNQYKR